MELVLVVEKGPRSGEVVACLPSAGANFTVRIGRVVRGNTFAIKDPAISQKHLIIQFPSSSSSSSSGWVLTDLDTSNGTLINGHDLSPSVSHPLSPGDVIKIGEQTTIAVRSGGVGAYQEVEEQQTDRRATRGSSLRATSAKTVTREPARRGRGGRRQGIRARSELATIEEGKDGILEIRGEELEVEGFEEKMDLGKKRGRGKGRKAAGTSRHATQKKSPWVDVGKPELVELRDEVVEVEGDGILIEDGILDQSAVEKSKTYAQVETEPVKIGEAKKDSGEKKGKGRRRRPGVTGSSAKVPVEAAEGVDQTKEGVEEEVKEIEIDMENMTLEEWFGQVEKYLTRVITDTSEEIIAELREKAARSREFIIKNGAVAG